MLHFHERGITMGKFAQKIEIILPGKQSKFLAETPQVTAFNYGCKAIILDSLVFSSQEACFVKKEDYEKFGCTNLYQYANFLIDILTLSRVKATSIIHMVAIPAQTDLFTA